MKRILLLATVCLISINGFAQIEGAPTSYMTSPSRGISSHGIRVSLLRPTNWVMQSTTVMANRPSQISEVKVSEVYGAALGYAFLPADHFGFTTNLAFLEANNNGESMQFARLDGNLAYTWGAALSFKAGINLSHLSKAGVNASDIKWTPSLNYQAGVGLQLTNTFGLDVMHTVMKQKGEVVRQYVADGVIVTGKSEIELQQTGVEVALHATF